MSKTYCAVKAIRKVLFLMLYGSADNVIREADVEPSRLIRHDVTPVVLHESDSVSPLNRVTGDRSSWLTRSSSRAGPSPRSHSLRGVRDGVSLGREVCKTKSAFVEPKENQKSHKLSG